MSEKIEAIVNSPSPSDIRELFLFYKMRRPRSWGNNNRRDANA